MNCNCSTKANTASLYRNGELISEASASFIVCNSNDPGNDINLQLGYNRCGNVLRICSFVTNVDSAFINNAILRVRVCCESDCCNRNFYNRCNNHYDMISNCNNNCCHNNCCSCNSCNNNCKCREFNLCGLYSGMTRQVCFNLNRHCCSCYHIEAEVVINDQVVATESLTV